MSATAEKNNTMQQQRKRPRIEETNISGLPNEIWLLILSFVPEWLNLHFV
jgi:hypothetical protein